MSSEADSAARPEVTTLARIRGAVQRHSSWLLAAIGLLNAFIVISPAVASGYSWDDNVVSTLRGAVRASGGGLLEVMGAGIRDLFVNQGRLFPLSSIASVPLYFFDRFVYKLSIVLLVLFNLLLFSRLAAKIAGHRAVFVWMLVLAPTVFQMRYGPDALQGYHWVLQLVHAWTTLSLLAFVSFLEQRRRSMLLLSLVFFECALLTYEVAYAFFVFFALLAIALRPSTEGWWTAAGRSAPFFGLVVLTASCVMAARSFAGMPLAGANGAYVPSPDLSSFASTLIRHASAALPATYTILSPFRPMENLDALTVWTALRDSFDLTHVWLVGSQTAAVLWLGRQSPAVANARRLAFLAAFGALFWIAPGLLIALSPKYQGRNWIDWGMSYLPVYLSFFGVGAILVSTVARVRRAPVLLAIGLISGVLAVWTHSSNARVVERINAVFRFPREFAEQALGNGVFDIVPPGSYLIVGSDEYPGANPSFFRTHVDVPLRKVAGRGSYLGSSVHDPSYFAQTFNPDGATDVPLPNRIRVDGAIQFHQFQPDDHVYYFKYGNAAGGGGFAVVGRLATFAGSNTDALEVRADDVVVHLSPDWPAERQLQFAVAGGAERQAISLPGDQQPVHTSRLGRRYRLALTNGETVDLLSISVR